MNHDITHPGGEPPVQRVTLDMSVAEFAVLYGLHANHNGGPPQGLRGVVENGLHAALNDLHPAWAEQVREVASVEGRRDYPAIRADRIFGGQA